MATTLCGLVCPAVHILGWVFQFCFDLDLFVLFAVCVRGSGGLCFGLHRFKLSTPSWQNCLSSVVVRCTIPTSVVLPLLILKAFLLLCITGLDAICGCLQGGDLLDWTNRDGGIQEESFIQRIEALSTMGYSVLLSNYRRYFSLASYLSTFSKESIVISMGIPSVRVRH